MDNKGMKQTILSKILCKRYRTPGIPPPSKRNKPVLLLICAIKPIFTTMERTGEAGVEIV